VTNRHDRKGFVNTFSKKMKEYSFAQMPGADEAEPAALARDLLLRCAQIVN